MTTREQAVQIALTYRKTPYVLGGRLKGAGVDCATLLGLYLVEIGFANADEMWGGLASYSGDWFLHTGNERYLRSLVRFGAASAETICRADHAPHPGDIALFKVAKSRVFNHGAIVTHWPFAVHACTEGVRESNMTTHRLTAFRPMEVFDPFAKMGTG